MRGWLLMIAMCAACLPGPKRGSDQPKPDWVTAAEHNRSLGPEGYAARVAQAPKRAAGEEISVGFAIEVNGDAKFHREVKEALAAYEKQPAAASVKLTHAANPNGKDWYETLRMTTQPYDVLLYMRIEMQLDDVAKEKCPPAMLRARFYTVSVEWTSAYVRKDQRDGTTICKSGPDGSPVYPLDLEVSVPELVRLLSLAVTHIDTTMRLELPAPAEVIALTPPHRAEISWRKSSGGGSFGGFDD